jgi:hypothetical protein
VTCLRAAAVLLLATTLMSGTALAQTDPRAFPNTGYTIADDAIWSFFDQYGGAVTFGAPISREFLLMGAPVQLFQNAALQVQPDGSVRMMPMTDSPLLPYSHFNGLTVPSADPAIAFVAPGPDQPNYAARLQVFLQSTVPESWNGLPVQFWSTYTAGGGGEVWSLPTSAPKADPNNPQFIYERFENGILLYDASSGTTQFLPLGEYVKAMLSGKHLPADLATEAASSPLSGGAGLPNTDLTDAFLPDTG